MPTNMAPPWLARVDTTFLFSFAQTADQYLENAKHNSCPACSGTGVMHSICQLTERQAVLESFQNLVTLVPRRQVLTKFALYKQQTATVWEVLQLFTTDPFERLRYDSNWRLQAVEFLLNKTGLEFSPLDVPKKFIIRSELGKCDVCERWQGQLHSVDACEACHPCPAAMAQLASQ